MYSPTPATPYDVVRTVSPEALLQELRSHVPLTIVDVRDRAQVEATGTIAGARMYPQRQLGARITELVDLRATPIVVVSQTARRARLAALELEAAGFEEVSVLEGGLQRWLDLGYEVEERRDHGPSSRS
jgi:rhodanese-related sulfurtransferase